MDPYLPICIAAALLVAITAAPPISKLETLRYYDEFGDPTVFTYSGGHVTVECQVDGYEKTSLLDPDNKVISVAKSDYDFSLETLIRALLRLDITNTTKFGKYRCQYNEQVSAEAIDMNYRFCADTDRICWDDASKCGLYRRYCVETAEGSEPCSDMLYKNIASSWCNRLQVKEAGVTYCPGNYTACESELRSLGVHSQVVGDSCDENTTSVLLEINFHAVKFNDMITLKIGQPPLDVTITVSNCGPACRTVKALCTIKDMRGAIVVAREYANFGQHMSSAEVKKIDLFNHSVFKSEGFHVHKMQCTISNSTHIFGRLMNRVAYFGTKPVITAAIVNGTPTLRCDLVPHPPLPFRIDGFYFGRYSQSESDNGTIANPRAGNYSCIVSIEYLRCERHQEIWAGGFGSEPFVVDENLKSKLENRDGNGAAAKGVLASFVVPFGTLITAVIQHPFMGKRQ